MTRLIDVHAAQHDISESVVLHVDAAPAAVLDAVDRVGFANGPLSGVGNLGHGRHERLFGLTWHPTPGAAGHVDVIWDVRVEPDEDAGSYLSSTRRFIARDDDAREAMLASWGDVRTSADTIARRTLRTIKRTAEEPQESAPVPAQVELRLAA